MRVQWQRGRKKSASTVVDSPFYLLFFPQFSSFYAVLSLLRLLLFLMIKYVCERFTVMCACIRFLFFSSSTSSLSLSLVFFSFSVVFFIFLLLFIWNVSCSTAMPHIYKVHAHTYMNVKHRRCIHSTPIYESMNERNINIHLHRVELTDKMTKIICFDSTKTFIFLCKYDLSKVEIFFANFFMLKKIC